MGLLTFWWGVRDRERRLWAGGSRCSVSIPLHYFALDSSGKLEIFSTNNLFQVLPNRSPNHSMKHNRAKYLNHWKKKGPQQECKNLNSGTLSHLRTRIIHWPLISRLSEWEWSLKPMQWQNSRHRAFVYFNIKIVKNINSYLCTNNVYCVNTCFRFYILLTSQIMLLICLTNVVAGSQNYFPSTMRFNYWSCPTIFSFATGSRSILETVIQAIWQSVHRPRFRHLQCSKSLLFLLQRCQCISIFRIDQICWQQSSLICSHFIRQMKIFLWEEVNILMRRSKYSYEKK